MLISGGFDAGEPMLAADIARRMSVSSMPVREALARLTSEQALETLPSRRVRVPLLALSRARDIAAARALIECELVKRALPLMAAEDIAALEKLTDEYEAAEAAHDLAALNHGFHFTIYARAGSPVLLPFVESLWMQAGPYVRQAARLWGAHPGGSGSDQHRAIIRAIRDQDAGAAAAAMQADINTAFSILEEAGPDLWPQEEI